MIKKAVVDFNIDLSKSIIIGDKEIDIQTGKNAGIKLSILVRSGHAIDEDDTVADEVYDDLISFAKAMNK
jgi:D-glycero-D-manno-heptose 1,7-bisphosphate phosphatase